MKNLEIVETEVLRKFNSYSCRDFYIISFSENNKLGSDRLKIRGCNDLIKRSTFFSLEYTNNNYSISFTEKEVNKEVLTKYTISPELFHKLLNDLNSLDEMRSRKISSMSYTYGVNRSAQRFQ